MPPKGQCHTEEAKKKISEAHKGMKASEETKIKIGIASKGRVHSDETRQKISDASNGRVLSKEHKIAMSKARLGKPHPHKGTPISETGRKNMRNGKIGSKLSIETKRKIGEALKGEKSPRWKGGISYEPYCQKFTREFKERVREFYGRKCVECNKTEEENGMKHDVHHVNFDKNICCNDNKPLFVILCRSCHAKTNQNREYWEEHFSNIISEQYNGQCYLPERDNGNKNCQ